MHGDEAPAIVAIMALFTFMTVKLARMWMDHREKMAAIRGGDQANRASVGGQDRIERLENELKSLRETSMGYDMSFDTALQRLESRVNQVESRQTSEARIPAGRAE